MLYFLSVMGFGVALLVFALLPALIERLKRNAKADKLEKTIPEYEKEIVEHQICLAQAMSIIAKLLELLPEDNGRDTVTDIKLLLSLESLSAKSLELLEAPHFLK